MLSKFPIILTNFLSTCFIDCWEKNVEHSNYNCRLVLFLLLVLLVSDSIFLNSNVDTHSDF